MKAILLALWALHGAYDTTPTAEVRPVAGMDLADAQVIDLPTRWDGVCWRTPLFVRDAGSTGPWTRVVLVKCENWQEAKAFWHYPREVK